MPSVFITVCDFAGDIREMFESADVDNGKELHFNEFLAATMGRRDLDERRLRLAFDRLDFDHSGTIDGEYTSTSLFLELRWPSVSVTETPECTSFLLGESCHRTLSLTLTLDLHPWVSLAESEASMCAQIYLISRRKW